MPQSDTEPLRVEWSARKRWWTVRVRLADGTRGRLPIPAARSEDEAIAMAPDVAAAAKREGWTAKPKASKAPPRAFAAPAPTVTVIAHARTWIATQTYGMAKEDLRALELHLATSEFGTMALSRVDVPAALDYVLWLKARKTQHDGTALSSRRVRNIHDIVGRALDDARARKLIASNPMREKEVRKTLPAKALKVPGMRARRLYPRAEFVALISDSRIPSDRRVLYALLFLTGARIGEVIAARWRDLHTAWEPLWKLIYSTSIERKSRREKGTKTGAVKEVPVHPALQTILAAWRAEGWRALAGRDPKPDDLLVPAVWRKGKELMLTPRHQNKVNEKLGDDCRAIGIPLRPMKVHAARHTFITTIENIDGAPENLVREFTHPRDPETENDSHKVYGSKPWPSLCAAMQMLNVDLPGAVPPGAEESGPIRPMANTAKEHELKRGGRDSNAVNTAENSADSPRFGTQENSAETNPGPIDTARDAPGPQPGPDATRAAIKAAIAAALAADDDVTAAALVATLKSLASAPPAPAAVIPIGRGARSR